MRAIESDAPGPRSAARLPRRGASTRRRPRISLVVQDRQDPQVEQVQQGVQDQLGEQDLQDPQGQPDLQEVLQLTKESLQLI